LPIASVSTLDSPPLGLVTSTGGQIAVYDLEDGGLMGVLNVPDPQSSTGSILTPLRLYEAQCLSQGRGPGSRLPGFPQPAPLPPLTPEELAIKQLQPATSTYDLEMGQADVTLSKLGAAQLGAPVCACSGKEVAILCGTPSVRQLPKVVDDVTEPAGASSVGEGGSCTPIGLFPAPLIVLALCPGIGRSAEPTLVMCNW